MAPGQEKRKSRHFTVVVRRSFPRSAEKAFAVWTDPEIRRKVLEVGREAKDVREVDVVEHGYERYDDRVRNRLYAETIRRYLILQHPKMIVAQTETLVESDMFDQRFARQELLLFKTTNEGCEIVASNQCVSMQPTFVHTEEDLLNTMFDAFAQQL